MTSPSRRIDARIKELGDWRGTTLARLRALIKDADPDVVEEWKWRGVPVWEHDGIICTGETYKAVVKMTFAKGAALDDPKKLFNSSLEGNVRRAIDFREGDKLDEKALKALIRAAIALNAASRKQSPRRSDAARYLTSLPKVQRCAPMPSDTVSPFRAAAKACGASTKVSAPERSIRAWSKRCAPMASLGKASVTGKR